MIGKVNETFDKHIICSNETWDSIVLYLLRVLHSCLHSSFAFCSFCECVVFFGFCFQHSIMYGAIRIGFCFVLFGMFLWFECVIQLIYPKEDHCDVSELHWEWWARSGIHTLQSSILLMHLDESIHPTHI